MKSRLFFLLGALIVYRLGAHIPVPGIDVGKLSALFQSSGHGMLAMFNLFSGGALSRFTVFSLGIMPYISASIVVQLLASVVPSLIALKKEGELGRRKITQYTRYATLVLGLFQSIGIAMALQAKGFSYFSGWSFIALTTMTLLAGTMFLMWLGEQITERGLGNGISMIIFAGIVAELPAALARLFQMVSIGQISPLMLFFTLAFVVGVILFIVLVERAQRRIPIHYAKRSTHGPLNQSSHLPLKINMSGVIAPIFASSIILFPTSIFSWLGTHYQVTALQDIAAILSPGQPVNLLLYAMAVVFFCFFYTALIFDPKETADNLKKGGAFVPGIRPGEQTAAYVDKVIMRLTVFGSLYMVLVCLLPQILHSKWNIPVYFGGTSLLIIVVVSIDFMSQVQAHLMSHHYDGLMKKANLRGGRTRIQ